MSSFLTELLYITKKMARLGFKCPTDIITTSKLAIIHRRSQHSGRNAYETTEAPRTTVEEIRRKPATLPNG